MTESNNNFQLDCPSCGKPFLIDEQYRGREVRCPHCSATCIADDDAAAEVSTESTMTCPFCSAQIPANSIRCNHCNNIVRQPRQSPAPSYQQQQTSGMAIASLVLGLIPCTCFTSLLAIIFGHIALSKIKASNGMMKGRGMAIAGLILGYIFTVLNIIYGIFVAVMSAQQGM